MYTPYPYQVECLTALEMARLAGAQEALVVLASGLGKTIGTAFDIAYWLQTRGGRILYLCHQNDILHQSRGKFTEVLPPNVSYGFYHGTEKSAHRVDCLFASFQTMSRHHTSFRTDEFDYIVVDESHHSEAITYGKVLNYFKPKFLLGLTATPDRMDGLDIRKRFGEPVYYLPLEEALAANLLTTVDYRLMSDEITFEKINDFLKRDSLTMDELNRNLFVTKKDEEIVEVIQKNAAELADPRIIVFVSSTEWADEFVQKMPGSVAIHSKISNRTRNLNLEMFRNGLVKAVVAVDCFNEGIDIPEANLLVFLRSTISQRIFLQQLGRGLRKYSGKDRVIVLDFVANCDRIVQVKDLFDSVDRSRKKATMSKDKADQIPRTSFNFDTDKIGQVLNLVKRSRPARVSEFPALIEEYSPRNARPASQVSIGVLGKLWWKCKKCGYEYLMGTREKQMGKGCSKCENAVTEFNNLSVMYAYLSQEYSPKNLVPASEIRSVSKEFVLWKCRECAYEWKARPYSRTQRGDNCPSCARHIKFYWDNFAFHQPELLEEYSYINQTAPEKFSKFSKVFRWWICKRCNVGWKATAAARGRGLAGCPSGCSEIKEQHQTIAIAYPDLAAQYSSSNHKPIDSISASSSEVVRWFHEDCGRYWKATVQQRLDGARCPHCLKEQTTSHPIKELVS